MRGRIAQGGNRICAGPQPPLPFQAVRGFRLTAVLAALCVLNAFDLAFTQTQLQRGSFAELNVLAAAVAGVPGGVAGYKAVLFALGAFILYRYRQHWQSEVGAWLLLACCAGLMVWWGAYLSAVETCISDPAVIAPVVPF